MCLTGLDYFSTIGFQPGIAYLGAGLLSPLATLILVMVTLLGALPVYARVAKESPHGQGSVSMLERLLPGWRGKAFVLILLGFAATDFVITITLCAADATTHIIENPLTPGWLHSKMGITLILIAILGAVFLKGFREAIGVAVALVGLYLAVNTVLLARMSIELVAHPAFFSDWFSRLFANYHSPWTALGISLITFPKLALGLSGFETGVAVMPHIKGLPTDDPECPAGKIRNTRLLLITAAVIMSILLVTSAVVSTVMVPAPLFQAGGKANGRALAYLAHLYMGTGFGSLYDISTILILWFAGASAMAALLSLVPRYLPRYGMAPEWARGVRPLVVVFTVINVLVTLIFRADVDAQAGAFATGLLMLFTSAALAVALIAWNEGISKRFYFLAVLLVFIYTSIANMIERPEGLQISCFFIGLILFFSLVSRGLRATELRVARVQMDDTARRFVAEATQAHQGEIRILAHRPGDTDYEAKEQISRWRHSIQPPEGDFIFLEVALKDASDFSADVLTVTGVEANGHRILRSASPAVPNAIAALLLHIRDDTGKIPHVYMGWTEGHPLAYVLKYIFLGEGETAPLTREILRSIERNEAMRPLVHVG